MWRKERWRRWHNGRGRPGRQGQCRRQRGGHDGAIDSDVDATHLALESRGEILVRQGGETDRVPSSGPQVHRRQALGRVRPLDRDGVLGIVQQPQTPVVAPRPVAAAQSAHAAHLARVAAPLRHFPHVDRVRAVADVVGDGAARKSRSSSVAKADAYQPHP